jgi:hypothetical protein
MTNMADLTVRASLASVSVSDGLRMIGFAEGDEDEPYALFMQPTGGGPVRLEVNDEVFAADDAVARLVLGPNALTVSIDPAQSHAFGFARTVAITIGPQTEGLAPALTALRRMLGHRMIDQAPATANDPPA